MFKNNFVILLCEFWLTKKWFTGNKYFVKAQEINTDTSFGTFS